MIKQCTAVALMAMTCLTVTAAWAAREEHTFEVSLTIPSRPFYIIPAEPDWIHRAQRLNWDHPNSNLSSISKYFDVRHDTSAIEARLEAEPYLSNGRPDDDIALRVSFNGVELSAEMAPRQVVSQAEAAVGTRVLLEIVPVKPAGGYRAGDYSGNVLLLFNAKTPEGGAES
ncbi:CS1 type fimbrial major subunit [Pseudomonas sp. FP2196]|uniref:CS1 type fimbrial major subunit n=1 Tax=Pseudomonas sp. FP2196 TaxID=2954086 RepID=UPI00273433AB|nr:CS1 type fimbrial major subunit [Pseudomonas sp. FP2196]WLH34594.1 CS1 type fimbrial major subunit [Pseudomonas sp. FP2196]